MERAIATITRYISTCIECRQAKGGHCGFLLFDGRQPSSEDNNPYRYSDEIYEMDDSEKRAFKLLEFRGLPCSQQHDFAYYFRMLDEQLDNPIIPEISTDLLRLISKIDRIYSVIERSSDIIYYSFNDLVRASINKCLARIDYFYLEKRIDLYKVIKSVSHDYTREEAMQGMYPNLIISSYVRNSNILEMDHLTTSTKKIEDIANEANWRIFGYPQIENDGESLNHYHNTSNYSSEEDHVNVHTKDITSVTKTANVNNENVFDHSWVIEYDNQYPGLLNYLNALKSEGYVDDQYVWIKEGHTNYHAGWASKIIISQVCGSTYDVITEIIKIKGLADHASKCQQKTDKKRAIEECFKKHGLKI